LVLVATDIDRLDKYNLSMPVTGDTNCRYPTVLYCCLINVRKTNKKTKDEV